MALNYGGSQSSGLTYGTPSQKKPSLLGHLIGEAVGAPTHLAGNLLSDVKDSVVALPEGLIESLAHPERAAKQMGEAEWQTWSPLFHGHVGAFLKQAYDHPLAPLLDVATVFSLGLDVATLGASSPLTEALGAARTAEAAGKVGEVSRVLKNADLAKEGGAGAHLANLRVPSLRRTLIDPTEAKRPDFTQFYSARPMRHLIQQGLDQLEPHLPKWYVGKLPSFRYEKAHLGDVMHRVAATNLMMAAALKAGHTLTDPESAPTARTTIVQNLYNGLREHAHEIEFDRELPRDYRYVLDTTKMREAQIDRVNKSGVHWDKVRMNNAELAHSIPSLDHEITDANDQLRRLYEDGATTATLGPRGLGVRGRGRSHVRFSPTTDYTLFNRILKQNPRQQFVTIHPEDELATGRAYLSHDRKSGFVISKEGDLQNVFRNPGGVPGSGAAAVRHAVNNGALTLDAFDGFLPDLYHKAGFREVGRMKFNDEYAPEGWDYAKYGRPDVVFMARGARAVKGRYFDDFDQAKEASRVAAVAKRPTSKELMEAEAAPVLEQMDRLQRLLRMREKARRAAKRHKNAVAKIQRLHEQRIALQSMSYSDVFRKAGESPANFDHFVHHLPRYVLTKDRRYAALGPNGGVLVAPLHTAKNLGQEAANSHAFVRWAWRFPTKLWKNLLLGYSPRIITNNAVGNWFMYAMRQGGNHGLAGVWDAIRLSHGMKGTMDMLRSREVAGNWLYRYFGDEMGNVFGRTLDEEGREPALLEKGIRAGAYPLVHRLADEPVRVAAISAFLHEDPLVRNLMGRGMDFDAAVSKALKGNRDLRDRAVAHARSIAGDYTAISREGRIVRDLVPFYLWDRHILKTTGNLFLEQPWRLAAMQKLSDQGEATVQRYLGKLPSFLLNAIPLKEGNGRASVLLTQSLNPFETVGELADAGKALTVGGQFQPGDAVGSQLNPFLTGAIEQMSGHSLLTDSSVTRHGGMLSSIIGNTALALPEISFATRLMQGTSRTSPSGKPLLYERSPLALLSSFVGVPYRNVNLGSAGQLADQEHPTHKKKKTKGLAY